MNLFLGVEIGGTKQQLAVGTAQGELLKVVQGKFPLVRGAQDILDWMRANIPPLLKDMPVRAMGIGFGGPLESRTGRVLASIQVPGWEDFKLREWFADTFGVPTYVINDTAAGGYAELLMGAGRQAKHFFYTNIGTGIGGVLFHGGELYDGLGFGASYLGNTYIPDWTGTRPGAVIRLENICSGMHTEKRLRQPGYVPEDSLVYILSGKDPQKITNLMLEQAVRENDVFACAELERITRSFAIGLCNFMAVSPPDVIAIGGGVAKMGDLLFDRIRAYTEEYAFIANKGRYRIVQSELLDQAVLHGSVLFAASEYRKAGQQKEGNSI